MNFIADIFTKFGVYILGIIAILGTMFGLRQSGKSAGKNEVEVEATKVALKRAKEAKEVEREVAKMDSAQLDDYLDNIMRDSRK